MPKLTEKEQAKIAKLLGSVYETPEVEEALKAAEASPSLASIKKARKAMAKELRKIDAALVIYGLDMALEEAKALLEKA